MGHPVLSTQPTVNASFSYAFNDPEYNVALPDPLKEISGIMLVDTNHLACIEDESGKVYIYNLKERRIDHSYEFSGKGDYEGITIGGNTLYIMRSDGVLFEVDNYASDQRVENYYPLNIPSPDCEGIAFDKSQNRLLITSKGKSADKNENLAKQMRYIYCFNLNTKTLCPKPLAEIYLPDITEFMQKKHIQLPLSVTKKGKIKHQDIKLRISDISIHPLSNEFYILSSTEQLLYIFSSNWKIKNVVVLNETLFPKAEGITFNSKGDIYITNEGMNDTPPSLMYFPVQDL